MTDNNIIFWISVYSCELYHQAALRPCSLCSDQDEESLPSALLSLGALSPKLLTLSSLNGITKLLVRSKSKGSLFLKEIASTQQIGRSSRILIFLAELGRMNKMKTLIS